MNLQNIISQIEETDPEVYQKLDTRRKVMKDFANFGGKVALASIPFAIGSMFKKAYGRNTDAVTDVLQFALTLEYLEAEFYTTGLAASGLSTSLSGTTRTAIQQISTHETAHVNFLKTTLSSLGASPVAKPTFDFTAKGTFPTVFSDLGVFLAVSQTFEDTGVRAYKGQAPNLIGSRTVLNAALRIHSVEARHASKIRKLRSENGLLVPAGVTVKPWITLNQSGIASAAVQASYNGEENTTQAGVDITTNGGVAFSAATASESFDEPLDKATVLTIVSPFIV